MTPAYIAKLGLKVCPTDVGTQKIDGSTFETFKMVLASFQVKNKFDQSRFFQEIFLVVDISIAIILGISFLIFSNTNVLFRE